MSKKCAIHQPNFFPWLGFFDKIRRSDVFILLDDAQIVKRRGGCWTNRVKVDCHGKEKWLTCPIKKVSGLQLINQVQFAESDWHLKFFAVIENYYRHHKNFKVEFTRLQDLVEANVCMQVSEFNKSVICHFMNELEIDTPVVMSSSYGIKSSSSLRLIDLCKSVGAKTYLCGGGSQGYLQEELFDEHQLEIEYQNYQNEHYTDNGFIPGLSIIDYIMRR